MLSQSIQGGIQCDQIFAWWCCLDVNEIDLFAFPLAAMFEPSFPASVLNQNSPHRFSGSSKEMPASLPVLDFVRIDQSYKRFVDKGCGLKCLRRPLTGNSQCGQSSEFLSVFRIGIRIAGVLKQATFSDCC